MTDNDMSSELTPEMDVFSVGCVIAELFLEGTPPFTLPQLFKYRSGEYSPNASLDQIEDEHIRDMVKHMIQIDPAKRLSAQDYLTQWHGKAFPHYFYSFLYQYMSTFVEKFEHQPPTQPQSKIMSEISAAYPNANSRKLTDADGKMERMFYDFEKIMYFISVPCQDVLDGDGRKKRNDSMTASSVSSNVLLRWCVYADCGSRSSFRLHPIYPTTLRKMLLSMTTTMIRLTLYTRQMVRGTTTDDMNWPTDTLCRGGIADTAVLCLLIIAQHIVSKLKTQGNGHFTGSGRETSRWCQIGSTCALFGRVTQRQCSTGQSQCHQDIDQSGKLRGGGITVV